MENKPIITNIDAKITKAILVDNTQLPDEMLRVNPGMPEYYRIEFDIEGQRAYFEIEKRRFDKKSKNP